MRIISKQIHIEASGNEHCAVPSRKESLLLLLSLYDIADFTHTGCSSAELLVGRPSMLSYQASQGRLATPAAGESLN
jgi:hypothetical protein